MQRLIVKLKQRQGGVSSIVGECQIGLSELVPGVRMVHWYNMAAPAKGFLRSQKQSLGAGRLHLSLTWEPLLEDRMVRMPSRMGRVVNEGEISDFLKLVRHAAGRPRDTAATAQAAVGSSGDALQNMRRNHLRRLARSQPMGGLPPWMFTPGIERLTWLNSVIAALWPYMRELMFDGVTLANNSMLSRVVPQCRLDFTLDLGTLPIALLDGVQVHKSPDSEIILDLRVRVAGDLVTGATLRSSWSPLCRVSAEVSELFFTGDFRITLRPLVPVIPLIGAVQVVLLEKPRVDLALRLQLSPLLPPIDVASLPGFKLIMGGITGVAHRLLQYPGGINLPLIEMRSHAMMQRNLRTQLQQVQGVLVVRVLHAVDLEQADTLSLSDPYVALSLGNHHGRNSSKRHGIQKRLVRTAVQKNTLDPEWDAESFTFTVPEFDSAFLTIGVFDHDDLPVARSGSTPARLLQPLIQATAPDRPIQSLLDVPWSPVVKKLMKSTEMITKLLLTPADRSTAINDNDDGDAEVDIQTLKATSLISHAKSVRYRSDVELMLENEMENGQDFLGITVVSLKNTDLRPHLPQLMDCELDGVSRGCLRIELTWKPFEGEDGESGKTTSFPRTPRLVASDSSVEGSSGAVSSPLVSLRPAWSQQHIPQPSFGSGASGMLSVEVQRARNLHGGDVPLGLTPIRPFARIRCCGITKFSKQARGRNPNFNENFEFFIDSRNGPGNTNLLTVGLYNHVTVGSCLSFNPKFGEVVLELREVMNSGRVIATWELGNGRGSLTMTLMWRATNATTRSEEDIPPLVRIARQCEEPSASFQLSARAPSFGMLLQNPVQGGDALLHSPYARCACCFCTRGPASESPARSDSNGYEQTQPGAHDHLEE